MRGREYRNPFLAERADEVNHLELPADVQVLGGFIEKEKFWLLGKAERYLDALTFPSTQLIEYTKAQRPGIGKIHRVFNGLTIRGLESAEHSQKRRPALFDELLDRIPAALGSDHHAGVKD